MCYRLYLATPLTLSEVRSMLPAGVTAHVAGTREQRLLRDHLPGAQMVLEIQRGNCACDFVIQRDPANRTDETWLRGRGIRAGVPRDRLNQIIQNHRLPERRVQPLAHWQRALADFVAEHARNAGPSLYHRGFTASGQRAHDPDAEPVRVSVSQVRSAPGEWLADDRLTLVVRD